MEQKVSERDVKYGEPLVLFTAHERELTTQDKMDDHQDHRTLQPMALAPEATSVQKLPRILPTQVTGESNITVPSLLGDDVISIPQRGVNSSGGIGTACIAPDDPNGVVHLRAGLFGRCDGRFAPLPLGMEASWITPSLFTDCLLHAVVHHELKSASSWRLGCDCSADAILLAVKRSPGLLPTKVEAEFERCATQFMYGPIFLLSSTDALHDIVANVDFLEGAEVSLSFAHPIVYGGLLEGRNLCASRNECHDRGLVSHCDFDVCQRRAHRAEDMDGGACS